ncbi:hypothetical protein AAH991_14760 [Microbispora sp. ZYX-F-249]|uniref:Uncharacterized protein n=1 Tax=Microbispora maris TaxID=3144104 RepID=A0ABV0AP65_9ACTN
MKDSGRTAQEYPNGSLADDGVEFVLGLAAAGLAIAFSGGGALAADNLWQGRRAKALEHKSR